MTEPGECVCFRKLLAVQPVSTASLQNGRFFVPSVPPSFFSSSSNQLRPAEAPPGGGSNGTRACPRSFESLFWGVLRLPTCSPGGLRSSAVSRSGWHGTPRGRAGRELTNTTAAQASACERSCLPSLAPPTATRLLRQLLQQGGHTVL